MLPPPALDPALHRRIRAREPALRHEPLVHARRGVALLDGQAQIRGRPPVHDGRIPRVDQRPARMPRAKGLGRVIPVVGVPDHGRARYAEFPRYLPVAQALAVELPDTPSGTHRCRHFLSSREPSVWLTGTRESIKEPDDAGVLIPPAPSPPTPSKLNAQGVQEQVPTVNTFIRSHTRDPAIRPPATTGVRMTGGGACAVWRACGRPCAARGRRCSIRPSTGPSSAVSAGTAVRTRSRWTGTTCCA